MPIHSEEEVEGEAKKIVEALKKIVDPEIGMDIINLGLVYDIRVEGDVATIVMTLTTPFCPWGPLVISQAEEAVKALGFKDVNIEITFDPPWGTHMMSEEAKAKLGVGGEKDENKDK